MFLRFGERKGELTSPCDNTFTRVPKKLSLADLQNAFADFVNALLQDTTLVAAVDGKVAKQMKDENDDPIPMWFLRRSFRNTFLGIGRSKIVCMG